MHLWASAAVAIGTNCRVCSLKLIQVAFIEREVETLTILHRWKARDVQRHSLLGAGHSNSKLTALSGGDYFCDKIVTTEASIGRKVFIVRDPRALCALGSHTINTLRPRSSVVTITYTLFYSPYSHILLYSLLAFLCTCILSIYFGLSQ